MIELKKSKKTFLLLELLIALFLVSLCALPLVDMPMKSMREAIHSAWRMEIHRLSALEFASFKEKIYSHEIKEELILKSLDAAVILKEQEVLSVIPGLGKKRFNVETKLSSTGKKDKSGKLCYLLTFSAHFSAKGKFFRLEKNKRRYVYKMLVSSQVS